MGRRWTQVSRRASSGLRSLESSAHACPAAFAWLEADKDEEQLAEKESAKHGVTVTAFIVIFVAE